MSTELSSYRADYTVAGQKANLPLACTACYSVLQAAEILVNSTSQLLPLRAAWQSGGTGRLACVVQAKKQVERHKPWRCEGCAGCRQTRPPCQHCESTSSTLQVFASRARWFHVMPQSVRQRHATPS
jgi:hypothetical protein